MAEFLVGGILIYNLWNRMDKEYLTSFDAGDNKLDLNWALGSPNFPVYDQTVGSFHVSREATNGEYYRPEKSILREHTMPLHLRTGLRENTQGGNDWLY